MLKDETYTKIRTSNDHPEPAERVKVQPRRAKDVPIPADAQSMIGLRPHRSTSCIETMVKTSMTNPIITAWFNAAPVPTPALAKIVGA